MSVLPSTDSESSSLHSGLPARPPSNWRRTSSSSSSGGHVFQHTHYHFRRHPEKSESEPSLLLEWSARAHRKGGFPRVIASDGYRVKSPGLRTYRWVGVDLGDISWWVAMLFLVGSLVWCINGIASFCFFTRTDTVTANLEAWSAFAGGTLFFVGAILSYIESINPHPDITFGHEIHSDVVEPLTGSSTRRRHFGKHLPRPYKGKVDEGDNGRSSPSTNQYRAWSWFIPPRSLLRPLSIGFVANVIQLYGATVFEISVILGIPGVLAAESTADRSPSGVLPWDTKIGWMAGYWGCQVYAAPGFVISGIVFMIEAQRQWYKPIVWGRGALGWHVGFWNALGGMGFLLCGIFGIWRETSAPDEAVQKWGTAFSTFWGSWAFLIGSYIQYFETLNPHAA
ncbi:hypothetical protein PLICRDRAFT_696172 [Plicaturopsis crispa FD-325 SS-3]|nr:hypothetical protein PLICRDRAFT_696172 [Plicaturopsis crispa FD-325 SS-3]